MGGQVVHGRGETMDTFDVGRITDKDINSTHSKEELIAYTLVVMNNNLCELVDEVRQFNMKGKDK